MARNVPPFPSEILYLAKRYLWWQPLEKTLAQPLRLVAAIMDAGTGEECALVRRHFGPARMRRALREAAHGWFHPSSWGYWHHQLGLVPSDGQLPEPPARASSGPRGGRPRRPAADEGQTLSASGIAP